ncbi:CHAT domain-containing protein [Armillaria novae-zelandiae]|uniref:CHAT domain-containing protein n=1 Tax=Armillaria novae-zelandiae TaxID=153914 RepID=A0AA39T6X7_9AGAR|nr:CHAT domain-containing protein [Armillaria novae-zelandiae]
MSDFDDANLTPAIEPVIRIAYSEVHPTDLRNKPRADSHPNFVPTLGGICADCAAAEGPVMQESMMIKEPDSSRWKLMQSIQISTEIPSFILSILSRYPGNDDQFLYGIELETASLISKFATRKDRPGGSQVYIQLDDDDSVLLDPKIGLVVVPSRPPSNLSSADGNRLFDLPTTNGQSGPDLSFNVLIDFSSLLSLNGNHTLRCFNQFGHEDDLQNAISALDRSVSFTSDSDPNKPSRLSDLSYALRYRFKLLGDSRDLDQAIELGNHAVTLADRDRHDLPKLFVCLSDSYAYRFQKLGNLDDLNSAGAAAEFAVSISTEANYSQLSSLYALADCFKLRFGRLGKLNDMESAIKLGQLAFSLDLGGDESRSLGLYFTSRLFSTRFDRLSNSNDLEESISHLKKALDLTPEGSPDRCMMLRLLSDRLRCRFDLFGDPADLDEAIVKGTDAANVVHSRSPLRPETLNTLSGSLLNRFQLHGDFNDLTGSISLLKSAIYDAPVEHIDEKTLFDSLSRRLRYRYSETNDANDIDEAVSLGRCSLACIPDDDPRKPSRIINLVACLQIRSRDRKLIDDLEESITCGKEALSLIPDSHPDKGHALTHLGYSVGLRFELFRNPSDADEATSLYKSAALSPTDGPEGRLDAATRWARFCAAHFFPSTLEAYKVALNILPRVAWNGKSVAARHRKLAGIPFSVSEAVEWALYWDEADTALEWSEIGRGIVWSQLHNLRSPVNFLSDAYPDLAERVSQVAVALEKATNRDADTEDFKGLTMEEIAREQRRLATEWYSLVETVRALPGYEDFLGPKRLATLKNAAKLGPVILLNIAFTRCDTLILIPGLGDVIHIPLKDFTYNDAKNLQEQLATALSAYGVRTRASQPVYATSVNDVFMNVLKVLWTCIVKPILDGLAFSPCDSTNLPRLWWCPTGPLAFLPIHAAGDYRTNKRGTKLSDYVASSYTPTLTILLDKLEQTRTFKGLVAISQPNTPGLSSLPGTKRELQKIKERATGSEVFVKCLRGKQATPDTVLRGMSTCNWVHMACHATQEKAKPLDSTFHLHPSTNYPDGHLPLSQVIAKSFPDADFAYLSACQTATGDESLSEESVHLAAGMLMAGYRSVVATLWSIRDADAPLIADEVYSRLFKDGKPDSGNAAVALHHAVQALRKSAGNESGSFVRWVPFIHVGV